MIGELDRLAQFQRATRSDDGFSQVEAFADLGPAVYVRREDISDGERWRAHEVGAHVTTRFTVRRSNHLADLSPKDRLVCDSLVFEIFGVKKSKRTGYVEITAGARVDG